jgi:hypothetical protein
MRRVDPTHSRASRTVKRWMERSAMAAKAATVITIERITIERTTTLLHWRCKPAENTTSPDASRFTKHYAPQQE